MLHDWFVMMAALFSVGAFVAATFGLMRLNRVLDIVEGRRYEFARRVNRPKLRIERQDVQDAS